MVIPNYAFGRQCLKIEPSEPVPSKEILVFVATDKI